MTVDRRGGTRRGGTRRGGTRRAGTRPERPGRAAAASEPDPGERWPEQNRRRHRPVLAGTLAGTTFLLVALAMTGLPREGAALPKIARQALLVAVPDWKTTEPVNEIVYGTRGFDTFGETFLLLAAVVAVLMLARSPEPRAEYVGEAVAGRQEQAGIDPAAGHSAQQREAMQAEAAEAGEPGGEPGSGPGGRGLDEPDAERLGTTAPEPAEAMTVLVRVSARFAALILSVAAVYLAAWGYSPGGGFPAGAALAGGVVLLYAAFGIRRVAYLVRPGLLEPIELAGAAGIVAVLLGGLIARGSFGANWLPLAPVETIRSGGVLQPFSFGELVEVATGLVIAIFSLLGMRHDWAPDRDDGDGRDGRDDGDDRDPALERDGGSGG